LIYFAVVRLTGYIKGLREKRQANCPRQRRFQSGHSYYCS